MKMNVCSQGAVRNCTGCGMCSASCPVEAITIKENEQGFYRPVIDETQCLQCAACTKVCYCFDGTFSVRENEEGQCFAATNKNENELESASSGAVSIELMRECIQRGYFVVGAAYDVNTNRAVTRIAKTEAELEQFKGSKYFQSYTADAFRTVILDNTEQKYAIFATPCQIYAFSKIADLKKNRSKYILVDIFCHGCPSLKLWDKYLDSVKAESGLDSFDSIRFRSKVHGWHEYGFEFRKGAKVHISSKYDDPFHEMFFGMDVMNEACYDCIARSTVEKTDIRIGDFWGKRYDLDTKGVSAVIISSDIGRTLFSSVASKFRVEGADFGEIIKAQSYKKIHNYNRERREKVFALLNTDYNIRQIIKKRRKMLPIRTNIKRDVKMLLKHLPTSIYLKIKTKLG